MSDIFSQRKRSALMALIRSRGNKATELRLIQVFRLNRITGWRRGSKLTGRPDFVFSKLKLAVFADGCSTGGGQVWHGCPKHATQPETNAAFWRKKIAANRARDHRVNRLLRAQGWRVLRIWAHELARQNETELLARLSSALT